MSLFVRAGRNDNLLVEELVAPATAGLHLGPRVPMRALVLDATTAASSSAFRTTAEGAGLPVLIDPLTTLLQDEQEPDQAWTRLPFAASRPTTPSDYGTAGAIDDLINQTMSFQLEHGASVLIPPYFHAKSPDDPWFHLQLKVLTRTAAYLQAEGIELPVAPVLAGALQRFGPQTSWTSGVDQFLRRLDRLHVRYVPLALSASRPPNGDTSARLGNYLATTRHVAQAVPTIAWRQGQYGLAAVAVGAIGYQTGPGTDEKCDLPGFNRGRRPRKKDENAKGPFVTQKRIYFSQFGRSLSRAAAETLLNHNVLRGTLTCREPVTCCPDGATSMLDKWRQHALRTRGRELDKLQAMPDAIWRLNYIAREAEHATADARAANQVLEAAGVADRVPEGSFRALAEVTDALRESMSRQAG